MPNISKNKRDYLALDAEEQIPYILSVKEMLISAEYYHKKNVPIIVYGENDYTKLVARPFFKADVEKEIQYIANSLSPNTRVGYIAKEFGKDTEKVHFEAFIINKKQDKSIEIVKPLNWWFESFDSIPGSYKTNLNFFIKTDESTPFAQNDVMDCGTLSLMYLKQLLKNDAAQFQDLTLRFRGYISLRLFKYDKSPFDDEAFRYVNKWENIFYPSPSVLLYSQSVLYNKIIVAMLEDDVEPQKISHKNASYSVNTLKGILSESIKRLDSEKDVFSNLMIKPYFGKPDVVNSDESFTKPRKELQKILDNLPKFRQKWLEEYKLVEEKREQFEQYLTYSTQRIGKKIHKTNFSYINKKSYIIAKIQRDFMEGGKNYFYFGKLTEEYQNDKEIVLEALEWTTDVENTANTAANIISKLNPVFKKDTDVILKALSYSTSKQDVSRILQWIDPELKQDKEFKQQAVNLVDRDIYDVNLEQWVDDPALKHDKKFKEKMVLAALKHDEEFKKQPFERVDRDRYYFNSEQVVKLVDRARDLKEFKPQLEEVKQRVEEAVKLADRQDFNSKQNEPFSFSMSSNTLFSPKTNLNKPNIYTGSDKQGNKIVFEKHATSGDQNLCGINALPVKDAKEFYETIINYLQDDKNVSNERYLACCNYLAKDIMDLVSVSDTDIGAEWQNILKKLVQRWQNKGYKEEDRLAVYNECVKKDVCLAYLQNDLQLHNRISVGAMIAWGILANCNIRIWIKNKEQNGVQIFCECKPNETQGFTEIFYDNINHFELMNQVEQNLESKKVMSLD